MGKIFANIFPSYLWAFEKWKFVFSQSSNETESNYDLPRVWKWHADFGQARKCLCFELTNKTKNAKDKSGATTH